jgi:DNA-directed RNA polymerase specialized sigma24 family protein
MAGHVHRRTFGSVPVVEHLPWIYGAALAASASDAAADHVTEQVVRSAPGCATRGSLVIEAVRQAVLRDPASPFDLLGTGDREALALVRLAGLDVGEVAELLGEDAATVKRRLNKALQTLSKPAMTVC